MRQYYGNESGDGVGNRKSGKEIKVPHDSVGNYIEHAARFEEIPDQIGNSVHIAPTHLQSNVARRRGEHVPPQRIGKYLVGGVNPLVAGLSHLVPETPPPTPVDHGASAPKTAGQQAQNDKRLRKLFEFDEDDRVEYTLTSTPEEKRAQVEQVVKTIFDLGGASAVITATLDESAEKPIVLVSVESPIFKNDELPWAAFGFLVNKAVNRLHSDRIKLSMNLV